MVEKDLSDDAFEMVKCEMEEYSSIESVERTEYSDIILVNVKSDNYRPPLFNEVLNGYGLELSHIDFGDNTLEYTIA